MQPARSTLAAVAGGDSAIRHRMSSLDGEWTTDRAVYTVGAAAVLAAVALAATVDRRLLYLGGLAGGLLLMHAAGGHSPAADAARFLGVRSDADLARERDQLHAALGRGAVGTPVPNL